MESVVGIDDYLVSVRGKSKVYHANLLKKYYQRDGAIGTMEAIGDALLDTVGNRGE